MKKFHTVFLVGNFTENKMFFTHHFAKHALFQSKQEIVFTSVIKYFSSLFRSIIGSERSVFLHVLRCWCREKLICFVTCCHSQHSYKNCNRLGRVMPAKFVVNEQRREISRLHYRMRFPWAACLWKNQLWKLKHTFCKPRLLVSFVLVETRGFRNASKCGNFRYNS